MLAIDPKLTKKSLKKIENPNLRAPRRFARSFLTQNVEHDAHIHFAQKPREMP